MEKKARIEARRDLIFFDIVLVFEVKGFNFVCDGDDVANRLFPFGR